ncbi:DUF488 domain-containing protein [Christiangramia fulva]|uniref:DUF488 domain-containing protein n=1 Tax=Christiangramia fulva TaxID=2126553 RepID=A0A2R3ZA71_9FLAO|nr:DUF488 family protein [Christiangramia fulva]AVR47175.1 DUF488 domain-containing protein [Christiangramia fulva]
MAKNLKLKTKRIYENPANNDGYRLLVDRIWPRGISKEKAQLDEWNKDLAPSDDLRKWFGHQEEKFQEFKERYRKELENCEEELERLREMSKKKRICILYGAKDKEHNQAVVLKDVLESK